MPKSGSALEFVEEALRNDPELVKLAIKNASEQSTNPLKWAGKSLQSDRDFIKRILSMPNSGSTLEFADEPLRNDPELVELAIRNRRKTDPHPLQWASKELNSNREFIKKILALPISDNSETTLKFVNEQFKNDPELVEIAIKVNNDAIKEASQGLRADKEFVKKMLMLPKINTRSIFNAAHDVLKKDRELACMAVKLNPFLPRN